jgi:hypothetical protein
MERNGEIHNDSKIKRATIDEDVAYLDGTSTSYILAYHFLL